MSPIVLGNGNQHSVTDISNVPVGQKGNTNTHHMEAIRPLFNFVFYMIDKVHRIKLSKESKLKSEKNRQKAMDSYEKSIHLQRQEAAQQRKVEKIRQEKEKLMAEEDPDRARKLEVIVADVPRWR